MGAKRRRLRQYLYASIACLIPLAVIACVPCKQMPPEPPAPAHEERVPLGGVEDLISRGDFEGAMKECQKILSLSAEAAPGDEALMNMGLISAHYANPKKDYKKAMGYFMRVQKDFPQSRYAEEAKIWTGVLRSFEKAKQVDLDIQEKKRGLGN